MPNIPKIDLSGGAKFKRLPCGHFLHFATEMFTTASIDIHSLKCTKCGIEHLMSDLTDLELKIKNVVWDIPEDDTCECCGQKLP